MSPYRESRIFRAILGLFFLALIGYALYEARGILIGPSISVPGDAIVVTEPFTRIRGRAERITEIRLNGKPIPVTENGEFDEPFLLAEGSNHFLLEAIDARGRNARKTLILIYRPRESSPVPHMTATSS